MVANKAPESAAEKKPRAKNAKKAKKPAARGRGRPEIEVSQEQREKVEILVGGGMSVDEIADAMALSPKTLRKHFAKELACGRSRKRSEILEAMFNSAKGDNVSAQKAYVALNTIASADAAWTDPAPADTTAPVAKAPKIGKKEQALEDASTAGIGTDWQNDLETPPLPGAKPN